MDSHFCYSLLYVLFTIVSNHSRSKVLTSEAITPTRAKRIQEIPVSVLESVIRDGAVIKQGTLTMTVF